jgi:uncharacterized protein YndB with AHSA1/START domain
MADPIVASIEIAAPPERVFDHFTDPALMVRWMGEFARLQPDPGGEFAVDIRGTPVRGRYVEVERPNRLVISWGHAGSERLPPGASTLEVRLEAIPHGTSVEVRHSDLPEPQASRNREGWRYFLPRLAAAAAAGGQRTSATRRSSRRRSSSLGPQSSARR